MTGHFKLWGYWNKPDTDANGGDYYQGIDALRAYRMGIITQQEYLDLLVRAREILLTAGFEDLNLRGNHLLISLDRQGALITDSRGLPEIRVCNFEFLKRI